jgi:FKBP-type peptidyl-prolyl cis-trans isomerase 2
MALTATLDKTKYAPGDAGILTVVSDKRVTSTDLNIAAAGETLKVTVTVVSPVTVTATLATTLISDDNVTSKYTFRV